MVSWKVEPTWLTTWVCTCVTHSRAPVPAEGVHVVAYGAPFQTCVPGTPTSDVDHAAESVSR